MKSIRSHFTREDGMSLIEVVIAAAILFIIMTGVLGLIGRTLLIGAQAKEINVSNNAVNSYVEWVRSRPFADVSSSMETTVVVTEEYTITIDPDVDDGANSELKELTLSVTVDRADGFTKTYSTMVVIRNRDQLMTAGSRSPTTDPQVKFVSPSPPDGAVLWDDDYGSWWKNSSGSTVPVQFQVEVKPSSGRTIQMVRLLGEQSWVLKNSFGTTASWPEPAWTVSPVFSWNLRQKTALNEPEVEEGLQDIWVDVSDSAGAQGSDKRIYLVDNLAPGKPAAPVFQPSTTSGSGDLTWLPTLDGNTYSAGYHVVVRRHDLINTWPNWPVAVDTRTAETKVAIPTAPAFARYVAQVAAESPRPLSSGYTDWVTFFTRPRISGTYSLSGNNKKWDVTTVSITCAPPAFPTTGTTTYQWFTVNGATETLISGATTATLTRTKDSVNDYPTTPLLGYRCKVTATATGMYAPTGARTFVSNTVYPEMPAGTNKAFTEGTW